MSIIKIINNIEPLSLAIVIIFILIIVYITFFGLWPFNRKIGFFSLLSFLKKTKELDENIKSAIKELPKDNYRNEFTKNTMKLTKNLVVKNIFLIICGENLQNS